MRDKLEKEKWSGKTNGIIVKNSERIAWYDTDTYMTSMLLM